MFSFKNKKSLVCFIIMIVSAVVLFATFYATDGLLGDKEFSQYTSDDWKIAALPLAVMAISAVSAIVFAIIILVPIIAAYPALMNYVTQMKFAYIDEGTQFLVFDRSELKRACCREEEQKALWFSVSEYDLKTRKWYVIEKGRRIENRDSLFYILQKDYAYDKIKIYKDNVRVR